MFLNSFSVRVVGGQEMPGGYVEMETGKTYRLCLRNDRGERCDARVEIDGKHVGSWRLEPHSSATLERPAHDQGKFTFYALGTLEAAQAGLIEGDPNLGLVKVTFTPERHRAARPLADDALLYRPGCPHRLPWTYGYATYGVATQPTFSAGTNSYTYTAGGGPSQSHRAGGTGLSGHSSQEYGIAGWIEHDYSQQTVIHLRLVAGHRDEGPRPLTAYSTPVPPAVR